MKISFVGHASILIEAGGVTVLSDPWWQGPCFGAQWWPYPMPQTAVLQEIKLDYIYISHGHHDHLHRGTLATLPRTAKVLVSSELDVAPAIREMGFDVLEVRPDENLPLGESGLTIRIMPTHGHDTLMTLSDGKEVCINLNDALHSAPKPTQDRFVRRLRNLFPRIDYVFCGYGGASHFPNCYRIPGKDLEATARKRQAYFNQQWAGLIKQIEPQFGFPFAADVVFLQDELMWVNETSHNAERPTAVFTDRHPRASTRVIDIAPGFCIEDGRVVSLVTRSPLRERRLNEEMREQIERANRVGRDSQAMIEEVVRELQANISHCRAYLRSFVGDYLIQLRFLNSSQALLLRKSGEEIGLELVSPTKDVQADLVYTTRWSYLKWGLQEPYGDELLFVGSGGIFDYANRAAVSRAIHGELISLLRRSAGTRRAQSGRAPLLIQMLKRAIKRLVGRESVDLYNLAKWTVFRSPGRSKEVG